MTPAGRFAPLLAPLRAAALALLLAAGGTLAAAAQEAPAASETAPATSELTVGVYVAPPFVIKGADGGYSGMAVDLWETFAAALNVAYTYREMPTVGGLVDALAAGEVDVAVTNLTITRQRAQRIDFTQPWFDSGLRVLVDSDRGTGFRAVWAGLADAGFLRAYAWIGLVILLATAGFTLFDRRFDPDFPKRWRDGMAESFFTVMSYATSGKGPARKNLFGWLGRVWQGLWLIFGIAVVAYVTSSVTSVMTTLSITSQINSVADLPGKVVGVQTGSVSQDYAVRTNLTIATFASVDDLVQALETNAIAAAIGDAPVMEYYVYSHPTEPLDVVGPIFQPDKYGFGLPRNSPLRPALNVQILGAKESGLLTDTRDRYFGNDPT